MDLDNSHMDDLDLSHDMSGANANFEDLLHELEEIQDDPTEKMSHELVKARFKALQEVYGILS